MRIGFLDGLRGVAILLVLSFHAYSRWPNIVPYGDEYAAFFDLGWLGVQLFFLISGFVIFMTLERTDGFKIFIYKRWLRLFPAMLIVSLIVYCTSSIFFERPQGIPDLISLLPGITFIEPSWLGWIFGVVISPLEGAFWSLFVEFKFYVIASLVYYFLGRKYLVPCVSILYFFSILILVARHLTGNEYFAVINRFNTSLSFQYFGWFSAGMLFYLYNQDKHQRWLYLALCMALISSLFVRNLELRPLIGAIAITCLFYFSLTMNLVQKCLESRFLLFFGLISYPLYLIHENMMISMIVKISILLPWLPQILLPIISVAVISLLSYVITKGAERRFRAYISKWVSVN